MLRMARQYERPRYFEIVEPVFPEPLAAAPGPAPEPPVPVEAA
jgi:hypothetical protein